MSNSKLFKCRYSRCLYDDKDIQPEDDYCENNAHYHKKCFEYKTLINEIGQYYYENISNTVVYSLLMRTIHNIVFKKGIEPKYLMFALQYAKKQGVKINSPLFLHYIIDDARIKKAYTEEKNNHRPKINADDISVSEEQVFSYKPKAKKGFGDVIKKKQGG